MSGITAARDAACKGRNTEDGSRAPVRVMKKTILIVDDNDKEREIFSHFLQFMGGKVLEAVNGKEGLRLAHEHRPHLILLDLSMPVMDGWQTIEQLRHDSATLGIPVIALTASHLEWKRLKEAGFSGYLEKPIVPFRVLDEVEHWIGAVHRPARGSGSGRQEG